MTIRLLFVSVLSLCSFAVYANSAMACLGKTHFILQSPQENGQVRVYPYKNDENKNEDAYHSHPADKVAVYFSSKDDTRKQIETLIEQENEKIFIAVFTLTDARIAKKLIEAADRGVKIEIVTDFQNAYEQFSKIDYLHKNNIPIWCFRPSYTHDTDAKDKNKKMSGRMHHKFSIFSSSVLTGSLNFTPTAQTKNFENINILPYKKVIGLYTQEFDRIKKQCVRYQPYEIKE